MAHSRRSLFPPLGNDGSTLNVERARSFGLGPGSTRPPLCAGEIVLERYLVDRLIGIGGTSAVYRALDFDTGLPVALKVLTDLNVGQFESEVTMLSRALDPGIVRYRDHGRTSTGTLVLVTEWLRGVNAAVRLIRAPMSADDALTLVRNTARALSAAHAVGIVHRDLKPSNLFLCNGSVSQVKLLDFGLARDRRCNTSGSRSIAIGTVGYTAPELIYGEDLVTPAADVFSLGCVLFECLTGRPPFIGSSTGAVLVSILSDCPPLVSSFDPNLARFDDLMTRLLSKDAARRPRDAAELVEVLETAGGPIDVRSAPQSLAMRESAPEIAAECSGTYRSFVVSATQAISPNPELTPVFSRVTELESQIRSIIEPFGGTAVMLSEEAFVITLPEDEAAEASAERAAGCALALHERHPRLCSQIIATRTDNERAACSRIAEELRNRAAHQDCAILLNALAAKLLSRHCVIDRVGSSASLRGFIQPDSDATWRADGSGPCIGRERELTFLDQSWSTCIEDEEAQTVVIVGESGLGKTRLLMEWTRRARRARAMTTWVASAHRTDTRRKFASVFGWPAANTGGERHAADELSSAQSESNQPDERGAHDEPTPLTLIRNLVRGAAGLDRRASAHVQSQDLSRYLRCRVDRAELASWLHETLSVLWLDTLDLTSASDSLVEALRAWMSQELADAPLVVVVDDLHEVDRTSMEILWRVHQDLVGKSILWIGLTQPRFFTRFDRNASNMFGIAELRLRGLPRSACEALIHRALPDRSSAEIMQRLVALSDGNPAALLDLMQRFRGGQLDVWSDQPLHR